MKLYRITGEKRYLERARYFIDERGHRPNYFETEALRPDFVSLFGAEPPEYYQAHLPVREQPEATGHAVRAMYLYIAMADLALERGDPTLRDACDRLWQSATQRKMYLTGGIGASANRESFSADFDLPNDTAYAETCAAIGLFLFSSRMMRLHDEAKYADVMERCLYNGIISGLSLDGESYFYVNPLEVIPAVCDSNGAYQAVKYRRQPWNGCACCPPNIARTLASLGDFMYHGRGDTLYADLFHSGTLETALGGAATVVRQTTSYPWSERVSFEVAPASPAEFDLALRIPAWCRAASVSVNGAAAGGAGPDGYVHLRRIWRAGDSVVLTLPLVAARVHADPRVRADLGKVAVQRGPLVYCLEEADNGPGLFGISLPPDAPLTAVDRPDLLGGIVAISSRGRAPARETAHGSLYRPEQDDLGATERSLLFIPYYAWANREAGEMTVWLRE